MADIYPHVYMKDSMVSLSEAKLSIASSAVLYGLSVYTVFPVMQRQDGSLIAFRIKEHFQRLLESAHIIGIDTFERDWNYSKFLKMVKQVVSKNNPKEDVFARVTVHVDELVAGTRSRGLHTSLSLFLYKAVPIVPQDGTRLKTSVWRRIPDNAIPSRAKVNGAYVNSVLAKQDAIDSGYDDCVFLDAQGHVCELSAANIFIVRGGVLITPDTTNDLLEGINRRTILELAVDEGIKVSERAVDLTELYIADEAFACGTSAFIAPISEVDARHIGGARMGPMTKRLRKLHHDALMGNNTKHPDWATKLR